MKIPWVILAEGAAQDTRGAITLVAVNQNVFVAEELPAPTKRVVVPHLTDLKPQTDYTLRVSLVDPSGKVTAVQSARFSVAGPMFPSLPTGGSDFPVEFQFLPEVFGTYRFEVEASEVPPGESVTAHVELFVVAASEVSST